MLYQNFINYYILHFKGDESFLAYEQTLSSYPLIMLGRAYAIVERHFHGSQTQCSLRISLSCRSRNLNS